MKIYFKGKDGFITEEFTFDKYGNKKFKIVGENYNSGTNAVEYIAVKNDVIESGYDILLLNDQINPMIIKLIDMQKFLYEQKKAKKESDKKQKALIQKIKEIKFHVNIADNDLKTKVDHAKKFLAENCKVKIVLELRGRELDMKDFAKDIWEKIISNFEGYQFGEVKFMNSSYFTFITK